MDGTFDEHAQETIADERHETGETADQRPVQLQSGTMRIHELSINRPSIVAYLEGIPAEKQEIALVHALEVGVTEMVARRQRFKH